MVQSDLLGLIFVYGYVAILLIISEKLLSKYPTFSRKFVHIMVGNVLFILPLFATRFAMTFLAAAPFILLTFLMSPKSPIKLDHKVFSIRTWIRAGLLCHFMDSSGILLL